MYKDAQGITQRQLFEVSFHQRANTIMHSTTLFLSLSLFISAAHAQSLESIYQGIFKIGDCKAVIQVPPGASIKTCRTESFKVSTLSSCSPRFGRGRRAFAEKRGVWIDRRV